MANLAKILNVKNYICNKIETCFDDNKVQKLIKLDDEIEQKLMNMQKVCDNFDEMVANIELEELDEKEVELFKDMNSDEFVEFFENLLK